MTTRAPLTLPPYTPTDWELRLPGYPIIGNRWRSSSFPEALGSLPNGAEWRLTYSNRTSAETLALLLPWRATGGGQWPLTQLPQEIAYGVDDIEFLKRLTGTIWRIAREPQKQSVKNGRFTVTIELVYELTLEVSYVDVFQDGNATGFALSIATSFAAGAAGGGTAASAAAGFALSVDASFVGGAATGERDGAADGFALDIGVSFAAGAAVVEDGVAATGFALSIDASFVGGAAAAEQNTEAAGFDLSVTTSFAGGDAQVILTSNTFTTLGGTSSFFNRYGFEFTVGATPLNVSKLGVVAANTTERVVIHRVSDGVAVASADIFSNATVVTADITPVTLAANTQYTISYQTPSATARSLYRDITGNTFDSNITVDRYVFNPSSTGMPTSTFGGTGLTAARFLFTT